MRARPRTWQRAVVTAAAAASLAWACRAPEQSVDADPGGVLVEGPGGLDVRGDRSIERHLATIVRSSREQDGERVIELDLVNSGDRVLDFAYTVEWLDRGGRVLAAPTVPWRRLTLEPGASVPLRVAGPSPQAESWRLRASAAPD